MKIGQMFRFIPFVFLIGFWGYRLFRELKPGLTWRQVLVTDWSVTALVLCLPVMLLAWFGFEKWRMAKAKEAPDA